MAGGSQPRQRDKPSTRYRRNLLEGALFELAEFDREGHAPISSDNKKGSHKTSESESSEIMTTSELISAVGSIWDSAGRPLTQILSKASSRCNNTDHREDKISGACFSIYDHSIPINVDSYTDSSPLVHENMEYPTAKQKVSVFGPLLGNFSLWKAKDRVDELQTVYDCIHEISILKFKHQLNSACTGSNESRKSSIEDTTNTIAGKVNAGSETDGEKPAAPLLDQIAKCNGIDRVSTSTSCLRHYGEVLTDEESDTLEVPCSKNDVHYEVQISVVKDKPRYALAKQEHALAGAMAGIFVSLCLHPVDTIKTVVQSCHNDQKPLYDISRSFISERGVTALYRGISTNLASSAPISALYTFTYESVKGALLPLFPKEYHSFAHCLAGGCASVATSFIFTPSERIKQQMQVASHYKNTWNALIEIIRSGGLPSLYAGWGAVLCRNIPHSIIKFYTYEKLKELRLSSAQLSKQNDTLMTLVCGGLAGSTAALFTTPFDVVKTRLQTQIPGSRIQFGVLHTLKEIGKREGLKGLYRGLSPRLVMYMTQGALFFASYESFKRLFSLDSPQPKSETVAYECPEDDPASLPSPN